VSASKPPDTQPAQPQDRVDALASQPRQDLHSPTVQAQFSPSTINASPNTIPPSPRSQRHVPPADAQPQPAVLHKGEYRTRASVACDKCRRSKVKCVNNGWGTTCEKCRSDNKQCRYGDPPGSRKTESTTTKTGVASASGEVSAFVFLPPSSHFCLVPYHHASIVRP
jgi:hypothetical protein